MFDHRLFTLRSPYPGRPNTKQILLLAHKARNKGMVWNNVRYDKKFAILVHREYGPQKVQKWAKNTSKLHCSSHVRARDIIFLFLPSIQMLTIPSLAPNMCV